LFCDSDLPGAPGPAPCPRCTEFIHHAVDKLGPDGARLFVGILCERLEVERLQLRRDASFLEDLGADSLDLVELMMRLEEAFDISIPDDEQAKLRSVGDAIEAIERAVRMKCAGGGR
jgi:acyl carrier protein